MKQQSNQIHALKAILKVSEAIQDSLKDESKKKELELIIFEESRRFVHDVIILLDSIYPTFEK